jgi:hypothetical protein
MEEIPGQHRPGLLDGFPPATGDPPVGSCRTGKALVSSAASAAHYSRRQRGVIFGLQQAAGPARTRPPAGSAWWACSCPPHDAPRQSRPAPRCPRTQARAAQPSNSPLNRPPRRGWPSRAAGGYRGHAREHRWQADVLGRGRGRPLFRGQGLELTRPRPRVTRTCPPPAWRGCARWCGPISEAHGGSPRPIHGGGLWRRRLPLAARGTTHGHVPT